MFCAGRVPEEDLKRTMKACGGSVMSTAHDLNDSVLGSCDYFEERQVGGERYFNISHIYIPKVRYFI
jgi:T-complex protein 1 subunit eta